jgi:hypothetical protein
MNVKPFAPRASKTLHLILGATLLVLLASLVAVSGNRASASGAGNCLDLDGSDDYVNVGNDTSFDVDSSLTIEAWVKPTSLSTRSGVFSTRFNNSAGSFQLEIGPGSGGTNRVAVAGVGTWVAQTGSGVISANEWTHIAYTRSGTGSGTHMIYVNGVAQTLISDDAYAFVNNASDKVIGSGTNGTQWFPGQIDELRVWSVARSAAEINTKMHVTLNGDEANLVAYYRFDHSSGTVLDDLTANSNDGTLVNMTGTEWVTSTAPFDVDFGDAPSPYATLLAGNGPRHGSSGPTLGATRDIEADGQPTPGADGDDVNGVDDEDGVSGWSGVQTGVLGASVTVNVQGGAAKLDAWVDWNRDGAWGGPFERIANSLDVSDGDNVIAFDVPSWANADDTYARFRLSTAGGLGVTGLAGDGEVEDHLITISSPAPGARTFYPGREVGSADDIEDMFAADVNGDGDMDILSASYGDDRIAWYENDGLQSFAPYTITTSANGAHSVFAADVDGDGDIDALSASYSDDTIAWYENDGSQNFTAHTITTGANGARDVVAADMDGDGDVDALSASSVDQRIAWYENDGFQSFAAHDIATGLDWENRFVLAADIDGDGDMDALSTGTSSAIWYENDGSQSFTAHTIVTGLPFEDVAIADMDGDGDMDVLGNANSRVVWYENDGSQNFSENVISAHPVPVFAADMDGDGDMDVLSASYSDQDEVVWFENDGDQNFSARTIDGISSSPDCVFAADVDGDGDLDAIAATWNRIAWYEQEPQDFGDAPAPYATLFAVNGPRHGVSGPTLGAIRDAETDGQPSSGVDGDDNDGIDDEDGVGGWSGVQVGNLAASVTVNVAGGAAKLDAWVDWNRDGAWGGPFEQIAEGVDVSPGDNLVEFDVPSWADAGDSYARFRLSSAGGLGVIGAGEDGEVEDHQMGISSPAPGSRIFSPGTTIATSARGAWRVFAADVDGDGDMDALSASSLDDEIAWYENDGTQDFTAHTITNNADNAQDVFAADVDGDGDLDALSASRDDDKIAWYENDGLENFTPYTIATSAAGSDVFAADMDGDGDMDVVAGASPPLWFENDGSQNFTPHAISAEGAYHLFPADVDGDGHMDAVGRRASDVLWFENDGEQSFTEHIIGSGDPRDVFPADVDGDGDMDVLACDHSFPPPQRIIWYENDGSQSFTPHIITTSVNRPVSVFAADMDGDGDTDVLSASEFTDNFVAWYENDGAQNFTLHTINNDVFNAESVFAADMDGDGDLDILSAFFYANAIVWHEQHRPPVADAGLDQTAGTNVTVQLDGSGSYDPDGNLPLTYEWAQTGGPAVALSDPSVVSPTFTTPLDPAVLAFTLVVTDSLGLPDPTPDEVVVTVTNPPVADAGLDQTVDTDTSVQLDGSGSTDPDGDYPLAYYWTQTGGPAVTLSDPTVVSPTFAAPSDPVLLTFTLAVTDSLGLPDLTPDEVVITVNNQPSVADAGLDQSVNTNVTVELDGSASFDPDNDLPLTYLWAQTAGPAVTLSDPAVVSPTFTAPSDPAVLTFTLAVTDSLGLPDPTPDEVVVTVNNQPPVADAGLDQSVDTDTSVQLDGGGSYDPDGDLPLTYLWTQTAGPLVTLSDPAAVSPTFTAPSDPTLLAFTLAVTDSLGLPDPTPDKVVVTVNNQPPVADASLDQTVKTKATVTLDGSGSFDPDNDLPLTYLWAQTAGPLVTLNDPAAVSPTFTAPGDSAVLTFTLTVTDSLGLADATPDEVVITVERYRVYLPLAFKNY